MSRDLTPREVNIIQQNNPSLIDSVINMTWELNGQSYPMYTEEEKTWIVKFPKLGAFGFNFLKQCRQLGVFHLVHIVEDYFNGVEVDKDLAETAQKWYEGQLESGYFMEQNDIAFAEYLKRKYYDSI
jgi:hypothetical protein